MSPPRKPPLIYSCSGCSSAAQMANYVAVRLDREGVAEMSCIAGVGGGVPALVRIARSGRPIIAVDGCPLACAKACLSREGVAPTHHEVLAKYGVKKTMHLDFSPEQAEESLARLREKLLEIGESHTDGHRD